MDKLNIKGNIFEYIVIAVKAANIYSVIIMVDSLINALVPLFSVYVIASFIDSVNEFYINSAGKDKLVTNIILLALIMLYSQVHEILINRYVQLKFNQKMDLYYKKHMLKKCASLKYEYIENETVWNQIHRVKNSSCGSLTKGFSNLIAVISVFVRIASLMSVVASYNILIVTFMSIIIIPLLILSFRGGKETFDAEMESDRYRREADYYHQILADRNYVDEKTVFQYGDYINEKWFQKNEIARKINLKMRLKYFLRMKVSSLVTLIIIFVILSQIIITNDKNMTVGFFLSFAMALLQLVDIMSWNFSNIMREIAIDREYIKDLKDFLDLDEKENACALDAEPIDIDEIRFEHVSFKYPNQENYVLNDLNLIIKKNQHYALVGENGCGKTTLMKLLLGLYDNYEGNIYINSKELRNYRLSEIRGTFSVAFQDFARYSTTIRENLCISDLNRSISDEECYSVLEQVKLDDDVRKSVHGLDTGLGLVEKDSGDLSGGQWQKIAIARVILSDHPVRILDEPTAALDPVAESKLYDLFSKASKSKTTITVTHRLGAAKLADQIVVLKNGAVAEQGSHDELMESKGLYMNMFENQKGWYENEEE